MRKQDTPGETNQHDKHIGLQNLAQDRKWQKYTQGKRKKETAIMTMVKVFWGHIRPIVKEKYFAKKEINW